MQLLRLAPVCCFLLLIVGCQNNSHYQAFKKNYDIVFNQPAPVELTWEDIASRKSDLLRVRFEGGDPVYLALTFAEHGLLKYRSSDPAVLVFKQGRLLRTAGLKHDLLFSHIEADPLSSVNRDSFSAVGYLEQDWTAMAGYKFVLHLNEVGQESFSVLGKTVDAIKYSETLHLEDKVVGENLYWFSADGVLLKSIQQLQSDRRQIEIFWLSDIYRHVG